MTVSNSSCLISLEAVGKLDLLSAAYGIIHIPDAVLVEWGAKTPPWIVPRHVANRQLMSSLPNSLGAGEAEAIALALETNAHQVILDDKQARRIASQFGLKITGTLGTLLHAKSLGAIPLVGPVVDDLIQAGFHVSAALKQAILARAGE
jgi:predicted nucleic acid-binding protein